MKYTPDMIARVAKAAKVRVENKPMLDPIPGP
jgi:hypothetical protein